MRFKDKVVIIMGGVQGIGKVMVEKFLVEGVQIVIWDINVEKGEIYVIELKEQGYQVKFYVVNIIDQEQV